MIVCIRAFIIELNLWLLVSVFEPDLLYITKTEELVKIIIDDNVIGSFVAYRTFPFSGWWVCCQWWCYHAQCIERLIVMSTERSTCRIHNLSSKKLTICRNFNTINFNIFESPIKTIFQYLFRLTFVYFVEILDNLFFVSLSHYHYAYNVWPFTIALIEFRVEIQWCEGHFISIGLYGWSLDIDRFIISPL